MNKRKSKIIIAVLLIAAALCSGYFIYEYCTAKKEAAEYTALEQTYTTTDTNYPHEFSKTITGDIVSLPYKTVDWNALIAENEDTVGWIQIPYSLIDYPVVQTDNNQTYLGRSFYGEKSGSGAIFMDSSNNAEELDQNTIIYGHNMGYGRQEAFGDLLKYNDKEYFETHRYIQFDTVYEQHGWWEVFAVIQHDMRNGAFNCLQLQFSAQEDFLEWAATAKSLSVYDTGVEIKADDKILTLSTCSRELYGKNGRQLILARKAG